MIETVHKSLLTAINNHITTGELPDGVKGVDLTAYYKALFTSAEITTSEDIGNDNLTLDPELATETEALFDEQAS